MSSEFFFESLQAKIGVQNFRVTIQYNQHTIVADEPYHIGGADTGMPPLVLLLGSLASSTIILVKKNSHNFKGPIGDVSINVSLKVIVTEDDEVHCEIVKTINLLSKLSKAEREELIQLSSRCPIHQLLLTERTKIYTVLDDMNPNTIL